VPQKIPTVSRGLGKHCLIVKFLTQIYYLIIIGLFTFSVPCYLLLHYLIKPKNTEIAFSRKCSIRLYCFGNKYLLHSCTLLTCISHLDRVINGLQLWAIGSRTEDLFYFIYLKKRQRAVGLY